MPIDPRSTLKYVYAVDLLIQLADDDVDVEEYCENTDPEQLYVDLDIQGYSWTGDGWYTAEYIEQIKAQAKNQSSPSSTSTKRRRRRTKADELELLRQWNAISQKSPPSQPKE